MDKRWRNLILIVVAIIVVFAGLFIFQNVSNPKIQFDAIVNETGYSNEEFSLVISSMSEVLDDKTISDISNFSKNLNGNDKLYFEKLIEVEGNKKQFMAEFNQVSELTLDELCLDIYSIQSNMFDKVYDLNEEIVELSQIDSEFNTINLDISSKQAEILPGAFDDLEYQCINFLIQDFDDFESDLG